MPLTATIEDIKAYQDKLEKNKITLDNLDCCPQCQLESIFFKIHAYRERRFLVIAKMLIKAVFCALVRFRCPGCGKTVTYYPDFAIPHKHYTRQTVLALTSAYVDNDQSTYQEATMVDDVVPESQDNGRPMAPSTIHRWVSTLADLLTTCQNDLAAKKSSWSFAGHPTIAPKKYKTQKRKQCLLRCSLFLRVCFIKDKSFSPSLQ